jgi:hypothetical protein
LERLAAFIGQDPYVIGQVVRRGVFVPRLVDHLGASSGTGG